jgi:hypothetical protein
VLGIIEHGTHGSGLDGLAGVHDAQLIIQPMARGPAGKRGGSCRGGSRYLVALKGYWHSQTDLTTKYGWFEQVSLNPG